ncbi:MAG: hypothetical protein HN929_01545 [Chloroflexi bacterium]|nr:hypothetical protein [Chloroflexota bacterium]
MYLITTIQRYIGLSTDTKPASPKFGSTFLETNTGFMWIHNGYAWIPKTFMPESTVNYKQISLNQVAADYSVMTATAQALFIDAVIVHVPDDLSAAAGFTSIAIATDDVAPIEILSAANGAKANLTGDFYYVYTGPVVTAATKIVEVTIAGGAAGAGSEVDVTVLWRPLVAGGYYLNA